MSWRDFVLPVSILAALNLLSESSEGRGAREMTWQEFSTQLLPRGEVESIVVDKASETVRAQLYPGAMVDGVPMDPTGRPVVVKFSIGSIEGFEQQLLESQVRVLLIIFSN